MAIVSSSTRCLPPGETTTTAVDFLNRNGIPGENIILLALIAAPENLSRFCQRPSDIPIYVAAIDERLDEHDYIGAWYP